MNSKCSFFSQEVANLVRPPPWTWFFSSFSTINELLWPWSTLSLVCDWFIVTFMLIYVELANFSRFKKAWGVRFAAKQKALPCSVHIMFWYVLCDITYCILDDGILNTPNCIAILYRIQWYLYFSPDMYIYRFINENVMDLTNGPPCIYK